MNQRFYGWKLVAVLSGILALAIGFSVYGGSIINSRPCKTASSRISGGISLN